MAGLNQQNPYDKYREGINQLTGGQGLPYWAQYGGEAPPNPYAQQLAQYQAVHGSDTGTNGLSSAEDQQYNNFERWRGLTTLDPSSILDNPNPLRGQAYTDFLNKNTPENNGLGAPAAVITPQDTAATEREVQSRFGYRPLVRQINGGDGGVPQNLPSHGNARLGARPVTIPRFGNQGANVINPLGMNKPGVGNINSQGSGVRTGRPGLGGGLGGPWSNGMGTPTAYNPHGYTGRPGQTIRPDLTMGGGYPQMQPWNRPTTEGGYAGGSRPGMPSGMPPGLGMPPGGMGQFPISAFGGGGLPPWMQGQMFGGGTGQQPAAPSQLPPWMQQQRIQPAQMAGQQPLNSISPQSYQMMQGR